MRLFSYERPCQLFLLLYLKLISHIDTWQVQHTHIYTHIHIYIYIYTKSRRQVFPRPFPFHLLSSHLSFCRSLSLLFTFFFCLGNALKTAPKFTEAWFDGKIYMNWMSYKLWAKRKTDFPIAYLSGLIELKEWRSQDKAKQGQHKQLLKMFFNTNWNYMFKAIQFV